MRLFECQACGQALYFENVACESCARQLGYLPAKGTMTAMDWDGQRLVALADPSVSYVYCANLAYRSCNWLIPAGSGETFCAACRHNRTIPDLSNERNLVLWRRIEVAKHRLFYSLLRLRLPLVTKLESEAGLAFDFLAPTEQPVITGHLGGVITINLGEADDAEREQQRGAMGEPYRTLLGHFRHEIAHYYWDLIVGGRGPAGEFRQIFGDESADYGAAIQRYYAQGAPSDWPQSFVSAYASSHPWEDFAETWAHYLHIVDTLETARAFGLRTNPRIANSATLAASVDFDPYRASIDRLIEAWLPLTFAFNSINRSMGLNDLYPFVLTPAVILKLAFVGRLIADRVPSPDGQDRAALRAVAASLKKGVAAPT